MKEEYSFLKTNNGKMEAAEFLKALKDKSIIAIIKGVSKSGVVEIKFMRLVNNTVQDLNYFFDGFGYKHGKNYGINIKGLGDDGSTVCGILLFVCDVLAKEGFKLPDNYSSLCDIVTI
jgi:hypothetical protein